MILYKVVQDTRSGGTGMWYGRAVYRETVDLEGLADKLSLLSTSLSKGKIYEILKDLSIIVADELLDSTAVRIDGVCILRLGMKSTGSATAEDFNVTDNVVGARVNCMGTGDFKTGSLSKDVKFKKSYL